MVTNFNLYDFVEMKKNHPCSKTSKQFQIVRIGADIKIRCLHCGNYLMFPREDFIKKIRKIIEPIDSIYVKK